MFSCVPMFESLLKMHPRDPSLVRPNGRRATRLAVRVPKRALRKPARCTGRLKCHSAPPGSTPASACHSPTGSLRPKTPINFLKERKVNWEPFGTGASSAGVQELLRPRSAPPFLRRSALPPQLLVLGQYVPWFKPGGAALHGRLPMHPAASCAARCARASPGCSTRPHAT